MADDLTLTASPLAGLTETSQRLAAAVEEVFRGSSCRQAADRFGVYHTTVWRHVQRDSRYLQQPQREAIIARAKRQAVEIADLGSQEIIARLSDPERVRRIPDIALNAYAGTATDKLVKLEQLAQPQAQDGLSRVLAALGSSGGTLSVSVSPNAPAIDVTPQREENE